MGLESGWISGGSENLTEILLMDMTGCGSEEENEVGGRLREDASLAPVCVDKYMGSDVLLMGWWSISDDWGNG